MLVAPHPQPAATVPNTVLEERWDVVPEMERHGYQDFFGNRLERLQLPNGPITLRYDALMEVTGEPDALGTDARELPIAELPDEVLVYTLSSRYCLTEALSQVAWHLFGQVQPGWPRVQAVCDWIHTNIRYGALHSTPMTTAVDIYVSGGGMCRDFAHLAITFCRALNIPARYVFGYLPEFRPPEEATPMDFHAWFEVYLGDQWWTLDARFNRPVVGRIPIGIGRDAVDVAMLTTWGRAKFKGMVVWSDIVDQAGNAVEHTPGAGTTPVASEGLHLEPGQPGEE
jgi:transglutaminase-like putative cysteine protease